MLHLYKHSFPIISGDICEYKLINSGYVHECVPGLGSITKGQLQLQLQLLSVWQPLVNYNYSYVTFNYNYSYMYSCMQLQYNYSNTTKLVA